MKGRGGYTDDVIPPRRKPVRIEDVDHMYLGARKAFRISDFANEDSDDLSRRSQKKDRKLLNDITTKLVNSSYKEPLKVHRTGARRPPVVTPVHVAGRKPATSASVPRRVGIRPVPSLSRTYRASSLPPRYVEEEVVTPYNFYEVAMPRTYYYRPLPVSKKPQYQPGPYVPSPAATAQVPTRTHRARSEPPLTRSSNLAVKNARRCLDRIERELGVDDGELYSYGPPAAPAPVAREVRARTAVRGGGGRPAGAVRRRPGSLPPPSNRSRVNQAEIEREVEDYLERPIISSALRTRAASLERTRGASLERQVRTPIVRAAPSLALRRSSLSGPVERMPGLDPYRPKQGSAGNNYNPGNNYGVSSAGPTYTAIAPYTPARIKSAPAVGGGLPPKAPPPSFRPEMSDTRKRIRDVICMTRRDPHYYS